MGHAFQIVLHKLLLIFTLTMLQHQNVINAILLGIVKLASVPLHVLHANRQLRFYMELHVSSLALQIH